MGKFKKNIHWQELNSKLYTPINQGIVLLKNGQKSKEAKTFYDFILS